MWSRKGAPLEKVGKRGQPLGNFILVRSDLVTATFGVYERLLRPREGTLVSFEPSWAKLLIDTHIEWVG